ncbi:unnamed protein product [Closterium sp. Naga37s-1]|nr:unnamed protein product [Closterium sp. Naga37s-1]
MPHVRSFVRFLKQSHRQLLATLDIPSRAIYQRCVAGSECACKGAHPKYSSRFPVQCESPIPRAPSPPRLYSLPFPIPPSPLVCIFRVPLCPFPDLPPLHSPYTYTSNGFAASLTSAEARRLKLHPAVAAVEEDEYLPALTSSTSFRGPDTFSRLPEDAGGGQEGGQAGSVRRRKLMTDSPGFLRLPGSLWAANGGQDNAGEGVIVGVIDTGPANPYGPVPRRWRGKCQATRDFPQSLCSRKLIGARFFAAGVRKSSAGVNKEKDFMSPRDGDGHGTWCASAAAGNANVPLTLSPTRTLGSISGVAPRARLATYKALWVTPAGEAGAFQSDIRAAVDAAVSDGVDVLSCSFGGAISRYFNDLPYLQALKAGVFIAFAAGNSGAPSKGQMIGTLSNTAPFYLTVGASTIGREYQANITLGNGMQLTGLGCQQSPTQVLPFFPALPTLSPPPPATSTIGRDYQANLTLGNGVQLTGLGFGSAGNARDLPLVLSSAAVHPLGTLSLGPASRALLRCCAPPGNAEPGGWVGKLVDLGRQARECFASSPDKAKLSRRMLVCNLPADRGRPGVFRLKPRQGQAIRANARARECFASSLDKSKLSGRMLVCNLKTRDVREAMRDTTTAALGAAAVLLLSASASSLAPSRVPYTDVPAIHLNAEDSETVRQYLSKATNPTASLSPPFTTFSDEAPSVAYFSSTTSQPRLPAPWGLQPLARWFPHS